MHIYAYREQKSMHTYLFTHMYTWICKHAYMHACMHAHIHTHIMSQVSEKVTLFPSHHTPIYDVRPIPDMKYSILYTRGLNMQHTWTDAQIYAPIAVIVRWILFHACTSKTKMLESMHVFLNLSQVHVYEHTWAHTYTDHVCLCGILNASETIF